MKIVTVRNGEVKAKSFIVAFIFMLSAPLSELAKLEVNYL